MYIRIIGTLWLPEGILNKDLNSFLVEICSPIGFNLRITVDGVDPRGFENKEKIGYIGILG